MRVTRGRVLSMLVVFLAVTATLAGRLVWIQGVASDRFAALAAAQRERRVTLSAERGSIRDRNGALLAMSIEMQTVYANPRFVRDPRVAAGKLAPVLEVETATLEARLRSNKGFVYLARKVPAERAEKAKALRIPGVGSIAESRRSYPAGRLAAHVLGFVGMDNRGLAGLEARYDRILAGRDGRMITERDPQGRPIPGGTSSLTPPVPGDDIVLTIDRDVQYAAEVALENATRTYAAKGGSIIVLQPETGDILALANEPSFDPNRFGSSPEAARRNRALVDLYEPGSANKVVTAAAAIEAGTAGLAQVFSVPDEIELAGRRFHDSHPHPRADLTLSGVIEQSSNVGTIQVALGVGKDRLYDYLRRFGYGRATGIDFPGEAGGILPEPRRWWSSSLPTIAVGQGIAATPLQVAQAYATVANGGLSVTPRLVAATVDHSGDRHERPRQPARRAIRPETARELTSMLLRVVEGEHGTGREAAIAGYRVAGKTGTAQKPNPAGAGYEGHVASFIGFAPAEDPKLVVAVVLDEPTPIWGGATAAPTARDVMTFALAHLRIGPGPVHPAEGKPLPAPGRSRGGARSANASINAQD
ncbi:MAG: peptidoglycan D,D-transpeptidase FtsI family protein [Actinomycetota bacterium]